MRSPMVWSASAFAVLAFACAPALAQVGFSDQVCPEATQYVLNAGKLRKDDPPQRVYDAAIAAANAYEQCSKVKLSYAFREAQHYADTRGAGFAVVAARALIAMDRLADARSILLKWRPLVQQVVDWKSETMAAQSAHAAGEAVTRAGDNRTSAYRNAAKEIVDAVDDELAVIADRTRDVTRPQAQQSPLPAPTRKP